MYNTQKAACSTYQKNDLSNLTPVQIIARLYQALDHDITLAIQSIAANERAVQGEKISHALAIIGELQANLNMEEGGEIAANLNDLYSYLIAEISMANIKNDQDRLAKTLETVQPLAEAWVELATPKRKTENIQVGGAKPTETLRAVAFQATF